MSSFDLDLALRLLPLQLWNTVYMVFCAAFFAGCSGLILGILLTLTAEGGIQQNRWIYRFLAALINVGRSFPFAILMVALIPVTRWLVGTSLGTSAAIVPLAFAAAPFFARLVETNLSEIDPHLIEAGLVMGSTPMQIVTKILLPEALSSLIASFTLMLVTLIGYSAMAGLVGGGGLGQVAIQYGYNRFNTSIMIATVLFLILLVQGVQWISGWCIFFILKKRGTR